MRFFAKTIIFISFVSSGVEAAQSLRMAFIELCAIGGRGAARVPMLTSRDPQVNLAGKELIEQARATFVQKKKEALLLPELGILPKNLRQKSYQDTFDEFSSLLEGRPLSREERCVFYVDQLLQSGEEIANLNTGFLQNLRATPAKASQLDFFARTCGEGICIGARNIEMKIHKFLK